MTRSNGDPIGSEKPNGQSRTARKGRYDGSYTGSEARKKEKLMRQFMRTGDGPGAPSEAYRNASCWCACGRLKSLGEHCSKCAGEIMDASGCFVDERGAEPSSGRLLDARPIDTGPDARACDCGRGHHRRDRHDMEARVDTTGALCRHGIGNLSRCDDCGRRGILNAE